MQLGVFLPNWIGDVAMATPALRALRNHFRDAHITGVARPYVAEVLAGTGFLDELALYDPRAAERDLRSVSLVKKLRRQRLDVALLLTGSFRTALLAWAGGAKRRVGFARHGRSWLLTDRLQPVTRGGRPVPAPVLDDYLRLAYTLDCPTESPRLELATLPADEEAADQTWQRLGLPAGDRVVTLNVGGAYGPAKAWPPEYAAGLARRLATEQGLAVVVLCGPRERDQARQIAAAADHPSVVSLADDCLSLGMSKAVVRRSRLLITTDSGPRHFAAAFGVPVLTLFGPTHIAWSETHYDRALHLQLALPCGPCQRRVCPQGHHRCMRDLSVDNVYAAATSLLARPHTRIAA